MFWLGFLTFALSFWLMAQGLAKLRTKTAVHTNPMLAVVVTRHPDIPFAFGVEVHTQMPPEEISPLLHGIAEKIDGRLGGDGNDPVVIRRP